VISFPDTVHVREFSVVRKKRERRGSREFVMPATVNDVSSKVMGYANYFVLFCLLEAKNCGLWITSASGQYNIVFSNDSVGILYTSSSHQRLSSIVAALCATPFKLATE